MNSYQRVVWNDVKNFMPSYVKWADLDNKNVLITGAYGMIASYIVYILICRSLEYGQNIHVYAMMRNEDKAKKHFSDIWEQKYFHPMIQNVTDDVTLNVKFNYIIHAASPGNDEKYLDEIIQANVVGTDKMLRTCVKDEAIFLYISSGLVYGSRKQNQLISEEDVAEEISLTDNKKVYPLAKRMGELLCLAYSHQYSIHTKVARVFSVFGPGGNLHSGRHFTDFVKCILENKQIKMNGLGYQIRSYCYVMDAINGIMTILLNGNSNDIYNVGSKKNIFSIAETKKIFSEYIVDDICKCSEKNLECDDYFLPNISKLEKIGWEEKIGMREMIQKSLSAYM